MIHDSIRWSAHVATDDPSASLPDALWALEAADPRPDSVIVIDNAPTGRDRPEGLWSNVRWLRNPRPQTHGRCHNQGVELALHASRDAGSVASETIALLMTPDVMIGTDTLTRLRKLFETDPHIAVVGPVVCRAHVTGSPDEERREFERSDIVDSAGVSLGWFGGAKPLGRGLTQADLSRARAPLGPSPSCFAIRLSALSVLSRRGPWFRETGSWEAAAIGLFRGIKTIGCSLVVAKDATVWRLASRDGVR
ncbi:MAG: hypothetical protein AAB668_03365 [Patescibacteria group bacterium]